MSIFFFPHNRLSFRNKTSFHTIFQSDPSGFCLIFVFIKRFIRSCDVTIISLLNIIAKNLFKIETSLNQNEATALYYIFVTGLSKNYQLLLKKKCNAVSMKL